MGKIKAELHGQSYEVTFEDGVTMDEMANIFANISTCMGYSRASVDRYIINFENQDTHYIEEMNEVDRDVY